MARGWRRINGIDVFVGFKDPPKFLGRPTMYDVKYCAEVIELAKEGKSEVERAAAIGISKRTYYNWKKEFPEFEEANELANTHEQAYWENLNRKGAKGDLENFNATALKFAMASRFKETYRESKDINVTQLSVKLSDDELLEKIKAKVQGSPELLDLLKSRNSDLALEFKESVEVVRDGEG